MNIIDEEHKNDNYYTIKEQYNLHGLQGAIKYIFSPVEDTRINYQLPQSKNTVEFLKLTKTQRRAVAYMSLAYMHEFQNEPDYELLYTNLDIITNIDFFILRNMVQNETELNRVDLQRVKRIAKSAEGFDELIQSIVVHGIQTLSNVPRQQSRVSDTLTEEYISYPSEIDYTYLESRFTAAGIHTTEDILKAFMSVSLKKRKNGNRVTFIQGAVWEHFFTRNNVANAKAIFEAEGLIITKSKGISFIKSAAYQGDIFNMNVDVKNEQVVDYKLLKRLENMPINTFRYYGEDLIYVIESLMGIYADDIVGEGGGMLQKMSKRSILTAVGGELHELRAFLIDYREVIDLTNGENLHTTEDDTTEVGINVRKYAKSMTIELQGALKGDTFKYKGRYERAEEYDLAQYAAA